MSDDKRLHVLYDGACPICRDAVNRFKHRDRLNRLLLIDINDPAFDALRYGISRESAMTRMHAIDADGAAHAGIDAIHAIHRAVGRGWLTAATRLPVLRPLFDSLYDWFARNRPRAAESCDKHCRRGDHLP